MHRSEAKITESLQSCEFQLKNKLRQQWPTLALHPSAVDLSTTEKVQNLDFFCKNEKLNFIFMKVFTKLHKSF